MKMLIVTTITTLVDADTFEPQHSFQVDDQDHLSEINPDAMGMVLINMANALATSASERFPMADPEGEPKPPAKKRASAKKLAAVKDEN